MADNTTLNSSSGGDVIRDIAKTANSPAKTQVTVLDIGGGATSPELILTAGQASSGNSIPVTIAYDQTAVNSAIHDGSNNPIQSYTYAGMTGSALAVDTTTSGTDGGVYNIINVPQVSVGGGRGIDGNVHSILTDSNGIQQVSDISVALTQSPDYPQYVTITGDPSGNFAGINVLEAVADVDSGLAFSTRIVNQPKQDVSGALLESDAPTPIQIGPLLVGGVYIIDTTGYQSLNITTQSLAASVTTSDDGITWSALTILPKVIGVQTTSVAANTGYHCPVIARYIKLTATTAGFAIAYLRATPWVGSYTTTVPTGTAQNNISQVGGTAIVTGGVAGITAVGGNIAPGSARTSNPIPVAGTDASNLTRILTTDTSGRVATNLFGLDASSTSRQIGATAPGTLSVPALITQEIASAEGVSIPELLFLVLHELRIANQQRHQFMTGDANPEPPDTYRSDPYLMMTPN